MPERMNLMLFELIDIGYFHCLLPWMGNLWICFPGWLSILLGAGLQLFFLRKGKSWTFLLFALLLCIVGELACHVIIGIAQLLALILYGLSITMLIGAVFSTILYILWKRRDSK